MYTEPVKVLISGAGIAGLALAALLRRQGIEPTVIEKRDGFHNIGFGISLWPSGRDILRELGIEADLMDVGTTADFSQFLDRKGNVLLQIPLAELGVLFVTRADLYEKLHAATRDQLVRFGTTIADIHWEEKQANVTFNDGTTDTFDLVVGAEGVHSTLRFHICPESRICPHGWGGCMFWLENELPTTELVQVVGKNCFVCFYPSSGGKYFAAFITPGDPDKRIETGDLPAFLRQRFADIEWGVPGVLESLGECDQVYQAPAAYVASPRWAHENAVLIGDAAHAMNPLLGMGVSLALEDAWALAQEIARNPDDIPARLQRFSRRRQRRLRRVQFFSQLVWWLLTARSGPERSFKNVLLRLIPASFLLSQARKMSQVKR